MTHCHLTLRSLDRCITVTFTCAPQLVTHQIVPAKVTKHDVLTELLYLSLLHTHRVACHKQPQ